MTQHELAKRAEVSVQTVQRFETTGAVRIDVMFKIAHALRVEFAFEQLFQLPPYTSIDEALARETMVKRKRAPRRRAANGGT
jgi:transcriptional regulator with XRE-family HTH domain